MNISEENTNRGFTLIELLVVIAIVGVLSAVVLASLNSAREKARDTARLSDMRQLQRALGLFYDDNGAYPVVEDSLGQSSSTFWTSSCSSYETTATKPDADCWYGTHSESLASQLAPYLSSIPLPPKNGDAIPACNGFGRNAIYTYDVNSDGSEYKLYAFLESAPCHDAAGQDGGTRPEAFEIFSPGGQGFTREETPPTNLALL